MPRKKRHKGWKNAAARLPPEGRLAHDVRYLDFALEHDGFRKPVPTFRDHALGCLLFEPKLHQVGLDRGDCAIERTAEFIDRCRRRVGYRLARRRIH